MLSNNHWQNPQQPDRPDPQGSRGWPPSSSGNGQDAAQPQGTPPRPDGSSGSFQSAPNPQEGWAPPGQGTPPGQYPRQPQPGQPAQGHGQQQGGQPGPHGASPGYNGPATPGYGQQPGYGSPAAYYGQPEYGTPAGHPGQPGYGGSAGYPGQTGYGTPAGHPGQTGYGSYGSGGAPGQPPPAGRPPSGGNKVPLYVVLGILLVAIVGVIIYVLTQGGGETAVAPTDDPTTVEETEPTTEPAPDPTDEPIDDPVTDEPIDEPGEGQFPPFPSSFGSWTLSDQSSDIHVEYSGGGETTYVWLHRVLAVPEVSEEFDLEAVGEWQCGPGIYSETSCFIETPHGALEVYQFDTPPNTQVQPVAAEFLDAWLN